MKKNFLKMLIVLQNKFDFYYWDHIRSVQEKQKAPGTLARSGAMAGSFSGATSIDVRKA